MFNKSNNFPNGRSFQTAVDQSKEYGSVVALAMFMADIVDVKMQKLFPITTSDGRGQN